MIAFVDFTGSRVRANQRKCCEKARERKACLGKQRKNPRKSPRKQSKSGQTAEKTEKKPARGKLVWANNGKKQEKAQREKGKLGKQL